MDKHDVNYEDAVKQIELLENWRQGEYTRYLKWRGIECVCQACGGAGVIIHAPTFTVDVPPVICKTCWGSGDARHRWTDLQALEVQVKFLEQRTKELTSATQGHNG